MSDLETLERRYRDAEGKFAFLQWRSEELRRQLDKLPLEMLDAEGKERREGLQEEFNHCVMELLTLPPQLEEMERRRVLALLEWRNAQYSRLKSKAETIFCEDVTPLQARLHELEKHLEADPGNEGIRSELDQAQEAFSLAENHYKQADAQAAIFANSVTREAGVSLSTPADWDGHARKMGAEARNAVLKVGL